MKQIQLKGKVIIIDSCGNCPCMYSDASDWGMGESCNLLDDPHDYILDTKNILQKCPLNDAIIPPHTTLTIQDWDSRKSTKVRNNGDVNIAVDIGFFGESGGS